MTEVLVHLTSTHRHTLLAAVPAHSKIWDALDCAVHLNRWAIAWNESEYIVVCDEAGAELLLDVARKDCPDAVKNLEVAINEGRPPRTKH